MLELPLFAVIERERMAVYKSATGVDVLDLPSFAEVQETAGHGIDGLEGVSPEGGNIDLGRLVMQADRLGVLGIDDDLGSVEESLRGNAADVKARSARLVPRIDHRNLHSFVGGEKCCGVAAGPGT